MSSLLKEIRSKAKSTFYNAKRIARNLQFAYTYKHLKGKHKIIYTLTPPPRLSNVGDHAQVVAIRAWFAKHFDGLPVVEVDKDQCRDLLPALQWLIQPDDLFFLHSGGNLGDRGKWSESIRRLLISTFPENKIISLPQTIYFSDTPTGRAEKDISCQIYAGHPNLTVIGRDPQSGKLAQELFPKANTLCMPDFVLSLPPRGTDQRNNPPKILLCLRLDDESALTAEQRQEFAQQLPYECTYFDTTLDYPIEVDKREAVLEETLRLFLDADVVVTDRYHGLIFTVLCQKPCVVLQTVDHKLTSAMHWFKDVPFVVFAKDTHEVPGLVEHCLTIESRETPDWNATYFDQLPELVNLSRD